MPKSKLKLGLTLVLCAAANLLLNAPDPIRFLTLGGNEVCKLTPTEGALEEMHVYPENRLVELQQMEQWFGQLPESLQREHKFTIKQDGPENVFISVIDVAPFYDRPFTKVLYSEEEILSRSILEDEDEDVFWITPGAKGQTIEALVEANPHDVLRLTFSSYSAIFFCDYLRIEVSGHVWRPTYLRKTSLREVLESFSTAGDALRLDLCVFPCHRSGLLEFQRRLGVDKTHFFGNELRDMSKEELLAMVKKAYDIANEIGREVTKSKAAATGGA